MKEAVKAVLDAMITAGENVDSKFHSVLEQLRRFRDNIDNFGATLAEETSEPDQQLFAKLQEISTQS